MAKIKKLEALLKEINNSLRGLTERIDKLEKHETAVTSGAPRVYVPGALAALPEHLRRSMESVVTVGQATAEEVGDKTGRSRAAESDYLNQLVDRGFLRKERVGKEIVFQVFNLHTICPICGNRVLITAKYCNLCGASLFKEAPILTRRVSNHT